MAKIAGVNVLVSIQTGTNSTTGEAIYTVIGGQSGASLSRSANMIETTDKTSGGWVTKIAGIKEWGIECEAFLVLGDAGYKALAEAFKNGTAVNIDVDTGAGSGNIKFTGKALISDLPMEFGSEDAVTFSVTFDGSGALTETFEA